MQNSLDAGRPSRWPDFACAAALALLPLLVFWQAASMSGVFFVHDVQNYFYPYHIISANMLKQGVLPLWNPFSFSGIPLIGDGQTAMFYPPNWLFFVLPGRIALNYTIILQFSIAGVATFALGRSLGLSRLPAVIAAISFMFCGFMTARVVHLSIISGAALAPLAFFCVDRSLQTDTARWFALAAVALALQAVAGHPQVPIYTGLGLGLYVLVRGVERWRATHDWRWLALLPLRLAGMYLLGYGLAAIQLAPWVELGTLSPRAAGASYEFVFGNSMAGSNWLLFLFPYLYGSLQGVPFSASPIDTSTGVKLWEHSAYVGILPLGLALLGIGGVLRRPGQQEPAHAPSSYLQPSPLYTLRFLELMLAMSLIMAAGWHTPFGRLIYAMPVIGKLRDAERVLALAALALALLAGFGAQRLGDPRAWRVWRGWRPGVLAIAGLLVAVPIAVLLASGLPAFQSSMNLTPEEITNLSLSRPNAALPVALALLGALVLVLWSRATPSRWPARMAVALVLADMGLYAGLFNPTTDPMLYDRVPGSVEFLRQDTGPYRKASMIVNNTAPNATAQEWLAVSWSMVYGIEDVNGFNSLQPRRYTDYLYWPELEDVSYGYLGDPALLQPDSPILSSLNVKYVMIPTNLDVPPGPQLRPVYESPDVRIYENTLVYPRAYFPDAVRVENDKATVLQTVKAPGFDGRRLALVESTSLPALPTPVGPADVTVVARQPGSMELQASTSEPRLLVLSEMDIPGWRATVNGVDVPIYKANYLFRAIVVPAGESSIRFAFQPASATIGLALSSLAAVVIAVLLIGGRLRRRR